MRFAKELQTYIIAVSRFSASSRLSALQGADYPPYAEEFAAFILLALQTAEADVSPQCEVGASSLYIGTTAFLILGSNIDKDSLPVTTVYHNFSNCQ